MAGACPTETPHKPGRTYDFFLFLLLIPTLLCFLLFTIPTPENREEQALWIDGLCELHLRVGPTSFSPCLPTLLTGGRGTLTIKAKAVSVEKNKQPLSFSPFRCFQHLKVFTYSSLHVQLCFTGIWVYTHPYVQGGKTDITQLKWVRSEEFCQAFIFNHMGPSTELFAHCPTIQTDFIWPFYSSVYSIQEGDKSN